MQKRWLAVSLRFAIYTPIFRRRFGPHAPIWCSPGADCIFTWLKAVVLRSTSATFLCHCRSGQLDKAGRYNWTLAGGAEGATPCAAPHGGGAALLHAVYHGTLHRT